MITLQEAIVRIEKHTPPLPTQRLPIGDSLGRFLAKPLIAPFDTPLFTQSAVDGYAVVPADTAMAVEDRPVRLPVRGMVRAGQRSLPTLRRGTAIQIFTGGRLPSGAGAVLMQEAVQVEGDSIRIVRPAVEGENVRHRGEEFGKGASVLPAGTRVTPPVIGLLASFGRADVLVHRPPTVALAVTGDELTPPGTRLEPGQIHDSNSFALAAAIRDLGLDHPAIFHPRDEREAIRAALDAALDTADVLITVGGISVGEYDLVKEVLASLGVETVYWRLAIKPGMPNYFGVRRKSRRDQLVFGLPGNPVAALLSFRQLVKPALARMVGGRVDVPLTLSARLERELCKKPGRLEWVRAALRSERGELRVTPLEGQGSHMLGGLAEANGLIRFPLEEARLEKGALVEVELLSWRD